MHPPPPALSPSVSFARICRASTGYWNEFRVEYEPDMNVISALQKIAESPVTADGQNVAPVVWECNCLEEVCGSCTMVINGRVRQACSALIDNLLKDKPGRHRVAADDQVSRRPRPDGRPFAALRLAGEDQGLGAGRQLLRHGPRPAAVAGTAGVCLRIQQVHELRLLPGGVSAVS